MEKKLQRVAVVSDNDGHEYVIPFELEEEFEKLLEAFEEDEEAEIAFTEKFNDYMVGGALSLVKLYADFNDLMA